MVELARRMIVASLDGRPAIHATEAGPFRISIAEDTAEDISLVIALDADATARLELDEAPVSGHAWRTGWTLELSRAGTVLGTLAPNKPLEVGLGGSLRAALRVQQRGIVRPLGDGDEVVPIVDVAHHRYTRQSSAIAVDPEDGLAPYAEPTEREAAPWWELDLGHAWYIGWFRIDLAALPDGARVVCRAYGFQSPHGDPPPHSEIETTYERDGARGWVVAEPRTVARFLRIDVIAAAPVTLAVLGAEVLASELHADTLLATLRRAVAIFRERPLCVDPVLTYANAWRRAMAIARALAARLEGGARPVIAVMIGNRAEWLLVEFAAIARGYVVVALAPDDPDDRIASILARTRAVAAIAEGDTAVRVAAIAPQLALIVGLDRTSAGAVVGFDALEAEGKSLDDPPAVARRSEDDPFALLFTSGSTGTPKGAMRSYGAFFDVVASYQINHSPRHLSFQPLSHLSERMYLPSVAIWGGTIAFSRGGAHLLDELRAFEPTTVGAVPRVFEVVHAAYARRLRAAIAAEPETPRGRLEARCLAEARATFGSRVMAVSVGSAPVSAEVFAFMKRCFPDIWVSEGYGSTEVGSIAFDGKIADKVDVRLVPGPDRGEIYVKSPHAITGYLGDDGYTSPLDADGYFATGDLGERDAEGKVRVIGRLRNTVKLAQGEFVSAERIEIALASDPVVDRIYVHVESGAPGVAALVVPHADELARLLGTDPPAMAALRVMAALRARGRGGGLAAYEIPRAVLLEETLAPDLLTTSGKLARATLAERYGATLAALASGGVVADTEPEVDDRDLLARVVRAARTVTGTDVDPREPLGSGVGVDSLAAAEILAVLAEDLGREVPLAWWFEARTLEDLANRLGRFAGGEAGAQTELAIADRELAAAGPTAPPRPQPPRRVLLTGATGFLGAHLVEAFAARGIGVTCLVRATDDAAATVRLAAALAKHRVPAPANVTAIAGDLAHVDPALAIGACDAIVHAGATVSWLASYHALRGPNVLGTQALLAVAAARGLAMHHVSTISVAPLGGDESTTLPFEAALAGTPYGLSKWLAERVALRARAAGLPVEIYRPAMIANHSTRGAGNADDYLNRYFTGCKELGLYVDRDDAILDLTPVDFVAAAIAALVVARPAPDATYHLVNVDQSPSFAAIGRAFVAAGHALRPASYAEFRAALLAHPTSRLHALAAFFPERFALGMGPWPCAATLAALGSLGVVRPAIDAAILEVYARSVR